MIPIPMQLQLVIIFFNFFLFDLYILYNCFFLIYYVSIVIDPQFKLGYYQKQEWEQYYIDAAKKIFTDTFKNFYQDNIDDANNRENTNDQSYFISNIIIKILFIYKFLFFIIIGTSVPAKRIFSGGGDLITKRRASLNSESIQACMCLKNWLKLNRK